MAFNPNQPRDSSGRFSSGEASVGKDKPVTSKVRAGLASTLEPRRLKALAKLNAKVNKTKASTLPKPAPEKTAAPPQSKPEKPSDGPKKSLTTKEVTEGKKKIAEGASRRVFDDGDTVIKVAKNAGAKSDNKQEIATSEKSDLFAKVVDHAKDGSWLRQEKLTSVPPNDSGSAKAQKAYVAHANDVATALGASPADAKKTYSVTATDALGGTYEAKGKDLLFAAVSEAANPGSVKGLPKSAKSIVDKIKALKKSVPNLSVGDLAYAHQWGLDKSGKARIVDFSFTDEAFSRTDSGDFDESKHPRAADGKFGSGSGKENTRAAGDKSVRSEVLSYHKDQLREAKAAHEKSPSAATAKRLREAVADLKARRRDVSRSAGTEKPDTVPHHQLVAAVAPLADKQAMLATAREEFRDSLASNEASFPGDKSNHRDSVREAAGLIQAPTRSDVEEAIHEKTGLQDHQFTAAHRALVKETVARGKVAAKEARAEFKSEMAKASPKNLSRAKK